MSLGFTEIILIVVIVLLIFGAKRIPELAKALGRASYEFKKAKSELTQEGEELLKTAEKNAEEEAKKATAETQSTATQSPKSDA